MLLPVCAVRRHELSLVEIPGGCSKFQGDDTSQAIVEAHYDICDPPPTATTLANVLPRAITPNG